MRTYSAAALAALVLLGGCAGTRVPRLAKCSGPYRYANVYGTVLPTLPVAGQPIPLFSKPSPTPLPPPASVPPPSPPAAGGNAQVAPARPAPLPASPCDTPLAKTSAVPPRYPSC